MSIGHEKPLFLEFISITESNVPSLREGKCVDVAQFMPHTESEMLLLELILAHTDRQHLRLASRLGLDEVVVFGQIGWRLRCLLTNW